MFLIDTHCHLSLLNYNSIHSNIDDVLKKAKLKNVKKILGISTCMEDFNKLFNMTKKKKNVFLSCGIHPLFCNKKKNLKKFFLEMKKKINIKKVIAIGETGLDYYHLPYKKNNQQLSFRKHIQYAIKVKKPLIVHSRKSALDTICILEQENAYECKGILHSFTEKKKMVKRLLDINFYISFSGIITFKNAWKIRQLIQYIPLKKLLIETDSPYLSPVPYRGKENQPAYLYEIAKCIAKIKKIPLIQLAKTTKKNFFKLFNLK